MANCCGPARKGKVAFTVNGMSCDHCRRSITRKVKGLPGVEEVDVSLNDRRVSVVYDPGVVDTGAIRQAIAEAGYEVAG